MDTVDNLYDAARQEPPFSNSGEGYGWMGENCGTCIHDKDQRSEEIAGPGCPLVMVALMGRTPAQWLDGPRDSSGLYSIGTQYTCVEYRHEDDGPTYPTPIPDPPGQLTLLPREGLVGVRMLSALPEDSHVPAVA